MGPTVAWMLPRTGAVMKIELTDLLLKALKPGIKPGLKPGGKKISYKPEDGATNKTGKNGKTSAYDVMDTKVRGFGRPRSAKRHAELRHHWALSRFG